MGFSEIKHNILKSNDFHLIEIEIDKIVNSLKRCRNPRLKKLLENKKDLLLNQYNDYCEKTYQLSTKEKKEYLNIL